MVDEVEIVNVKGDEVASEETLLALLETMKKMAASKGFDPDEVNKKTKDLANNLGNLDDFTQDNTKALEDNTDALDDNTGAVNRFGSGLAGLASYMVGSALGSVVNFSKELLVGGDNLSDFARHLPVVGSLLQPLTGFIDESVDVFREMSQVGATFAGGLTEFRTIAGQAAMPLDEFRRLVQENSESLKLFGTDTAMGARNFAAMSNEFRKGPGRELLNLGFTSSELNQTLMDFAEIQAMTYGAERAQSLITTQNAGEFAHQLQRLSAITGKRRDQIAQEMMQTMTDARARMALASMDADARAQFQANLAQTPEALRNVFIDMADGIPNEEITQRLMQFSDTFRDQAANIQNMSEREFNNFLVNVRDDLEASGQDMGQGFQAILASVPGLSEAFASMSELQQRRILGEEEFLRFQETQRQAAARNDSILQFGETLNQIRGNLQVAFVDSGILQSVERVAGVFTSFLSNEDTINSISDALMDFSEAMRNFFEDLESGSLSTALGNAFKGIIDSISDMLFGESAEEQETETRSSLSDVNQGLAETDAVSRQIENLLRERGTLDSESEADAPRIAAINEALQELDADAIMQRRERLQERRTELEQQINNGFEDTAGVLSGMGGMLASAATEGITSLWTDSGLIGKTAIAVGGLFVASKVVSAVTNGASGLMSTIGRLFGGSISQDRNTRATGAVGRAAGSGAAGLGRGAGAGIAGLGRGVGAGITGVGRGLASLGPMAPAIALGSGAVALAIGLIGGAIAGATWLMGGALEKFSEGLQTFEDVDGAAIRDAALGLTALSGAIAAFGAGSAIGGIGQMVGGITEFVGGLFGGEDPLEKLERFGNANIDAAKVETNARALSAMSAALAASGGATAATGLGDMVGGITGFLGSLFGAEDPMEQLQRFAQYDIDSERVIANANALTAFSRAMTFSSGASAVSGIGDFVNGLVGGLGRLFGAEDPMDQLQRFAQYDIDSEKVNQNANALRAFSEIMNTMPEVQQPGVFETLKSGIVSFLGGDNDPFAPLVAFSNLTLGGNTASVLEAVRSFAEAMNTIPEIQQPGVFETLKAGIVSFLGGDNDPFAPLVAFSNLALGTNTVSNVEAVRAFATAMNLIPEVQQPGVFETLKAGLVSFLGGDNDPFAELIAFSNLTLGANTLANTEAVILFAEAMNRIPEVQQPGVFETLKSGIVSFLGGDNDPFAPLVAFSNLELGNNVLSNTESVILFAEAMNRIPEVQQPGVFETLKAGIVSFLGGDNDPFAPLVAFSNLTLGGNVATNAESVRLFATAMNQLPEVDGEKAGGFFAAIRSIFGGETVMPWDQVREFGEVDINVEAVTANAAAMQAFGNALSGFSNFEVSELDIPNRFTNNLVTISNINGTGLDTIASGLERLVGVTGVRAQLDAINEGLDSTGIRTYSSAIDELIEKMNELNEVLAESNDTLLRDNMSAAEVLGNINVSTQGSTEGITQLNTLLTQMLTILTESKEIEDKIERNTASLGNDTLFGRVSNIR